MKERTDDLKLSAEILKGKQSVRATFRLPSEAIELLSIAAAQLGLKQKTLFDQLVEDQETLEQVAREASSYESGSEGRRQKTFVLSKNSLLSLERVAKQSHMPRDILVEVSILRLQPVLDAEQKKLVKRRQAVGEVAQYIAHGQQLYQQLFHLLGNGDPVLVEVQELIQQAEEGLDRMQAILQEGEALEQLRRGGR